MNQNPEQTPETVQPEAKTPAPRRDRKAAARVREWLVRVLLLLPAAVSVFLICRARLAEGETIAARTPYLVLCIAVAVLSVLLAALWRRLGQRGQLYRKVLQSMMVMVVPLACFFILEKFTHDPMVMTRKIQLLNILFFYLLELVVLFASRRPGPACSAVLLYTAVAGIANNLAIQSRNIPVYPWDIASLGVALSVADNYEFVLSWSMAGMIAALAGLALLSNCGSAKLSFRHLWVRLAAVVLSAVCLGGYGVYLSTDRVITDFALYPYLFTPKYLYEYNGFTVSFIAHLKYLKVDKPSGYSEAEIESFMAEYEALSAGQEQDPETAVRPNVIVLMNEAFSDLSVLTGGEDYWVEEDPLAFFHSLTENTVSGYAYVSVKGGNTANTEFEFLTGLSMAYLPMGSIPYQQYIRSEMPSLATQFSSLGYTTCAMHPYLASGWNRDDVYRYFGFDEEYFYTDFYDRPGHYQLVRNYISDRSLVNKIIDTFREKNHESEDPMFLFAVTMQNHGGYTGASSFDNFTQTVHAKGLENQDVLTTYLSLLQLSDDAFEFLVSYFKNVSEPTVIVMFGDHQPNDNVVDRLAAAYGTDISSGLEAQQKRYMVPFVMWANYDIEEQSDVITSANYLSTLLMEASGLPLTPQQEFLNDMRQSIAAVNANGFLSPDGVFLSHTERGTQLMLQQYAMLQYNDLFDRKNRLAELFSVPPLLQAEKTVG